MGGRQLERLRHRLLRRCRRLGRLLRHPAPRGDVDLLDVLLRRGPGRRHPRSLRQRGADRGAVLLPRHPAGRRGPPLALLPPLLQGGDRGRRRERRGDPGLHPAAAELGLPRHLRPARQDGGGTAQGHLAAEVRAGDHALPPGRRGQPRPARPALHRGLLRQGGDDARLQRRDDQRLARRAAPHRLRRQSPLRATRAGAPRLGGVPRRGGRAPARSHALHPGRVFRTAEPRPRLHRVLRLLARGHLLLRPQTGPPALADDRLPDRGDAARRLPLRPGEIRRGARRRPGEDDARRHPRAERRNSRPEHRPGADAPLLRRHRPRRRSGRGERQAARLPVEVQRRRAVAHHRRRRLDQRRAGPRPRTDGDDRGHLGRLARLDQTRRRPAEAADQPQDPPSREHPRAGADAQGVCVELAGRPRGRRVARDGALFGAVAAVRGASWASHGGPGRL